MRSFALRVITGPECRVPLEIQRFTDMHVRRVFHGTATNIDGKFLVSIDGADLGGSRGCNVLYAHAG